MEVEKENQSHLPMEKPGQYQTTASKLRQRQISCSQRSTIDGKSIPPSFVQYFFFLYNYLRFYLGATFILDERLCLSTIR